MTDEELMCALDGLYAYDTGATDSGIHDEALRSRVIAELDEDLEGRLHTKRISRIARELFLTDEQIANGYGLEDAAKFADWLRNEMI